MKPTPPSRSRNGNAAPCAEMLTAAQPRTPPNARYAIRASQTPSASAIAAQR
jgi:hypothetical protein